MTTGNQRKKRRPPGRCIFCGSLGLTKEHMWADWLRNYIPRHGTKHQVMSNTFSKDGNEVSFEGRTGDLHSRRIKCVCRSCNNGWMGKLQERAKPFLVPLLENRQTILRKNAKVAISSWVAMMIMVSENLDKEMISISTSTRQWFKKNQRPPFHWRIWIAHHSARSHELFSHNVATLATDEEIERAGPNATEEPNSHSTTILLGNYLLIHAMSSSHIMGRGFIRR